MAPVHVVPALTHAVSSRWYGGAKRFKDVKPTILSEVANYWNWWVPADEVKYPN